MQGLSGTLERAVISMSPARCRVIAGAVGGVLAATLALSLGAQRASAISSDYCGYGIANGAQCYEGSGYRGWRYHQASTGPMGVILPSICAYSWTGSNYRSGSGCNTQFNFKSFCNNSADPIGNSSVRWGGFSGTRTIYGHADSRFPC